MEGGSFKARTAILPGREERIEYVENLKQTFAKDLSEQKVQASQELAAAKPDAQKELAAAKAKAVSRLARVHASNASAATTPSANNYSSPVKFSTSSSKDLRLEVCECKGDIRVDVREWYRRNQVRHRFLPSSGLAG